VLFRSSVFLAIDVATGERVAIKQMKAKYERWEDCLALREIKSLKKLNSHENIIKLKEVLRESDGTLAFVFEYCDSNLYQLIKQQNGCRFPIQQVKQIIFQILKGLAYMHRGGFFHRDMKPENLLAKGETVVIADFGLAREIRSRPPYTEYVSTRWYRSPEVVLNQNNYSTPIDMWAVGAIFAEIITLEPLFPGQGDIDQIHKICSVLGPPTATESPPSSNFGGMVGSQQYYTPSNTQNLDSRFIRGGGSWPDGLKLASAKSFRFPQIEAPPLAHFIPDAPVEALQLISDMLRFDPSKRPTAVEALKHPWFSDLHQDFPVSNSTVKKMMQPTSESPSIRQCHDIANRYQPPDIYQQADSQYLPDLNFESLSYPKSPENDIQLVTDEDHFPQMEARRSKTAADMVRMAPPYSQPHGLKFAEHPTIEESTSIKSFKAYNPSAAQNSDVSPRLKKIPERAFQKVYAALPGINNGIDDAADNLISKITSLDNSGPRTIHPLQQPMNPIHQHHLHHQTITSPNSLIYQKAHNPFSDSHPALPLVMSTRPAPLSRKPAPLYSTSKSNSQLIGSLRSLPVDRSRELTVQGLAFSPKSPSSAGFPPPPPPNHRLNERLFGHQNRPGRVAALDGIGETELVQTQQRHTDVMRAARERFRGPTWPVQQRRL